MNWASPIVDSVVPGSGADLAGHLRVGDRIVSVDGVDAPIDQPVTSVLTPGKLSYRFRIERAPDDIST